MRILVVDDDEVLVDVLTNSLSEQRHIVDVAEDGRLGWEDVQYGEYERVLLDVNMPGLDGVSLCEKMRSEGYNTPILLMTAKNASQDRIQGLDAGADDYLTKPLDLGELNARVRALSRRGTVVSQNSRFSLASRNRTISRESLARKEPSGFSINRSRNC